jgi:hypothetical protein
MMIQLGYSHHNLHKTKTLLGIKNLVSVSDEANNLKEKNMTYDSKHTISNTAMVPQRKV